MSFPSTYRGIKEAITSVLLETGTARDIARKAGIRLTPSSAVSASAAAVLLGQFNDVGAGPYEGIYLAEEQFLFPGFAVAPGADYIEDWMVPYTDGRGLTEARLIANVPTAGDVTDSRLNVIVDDGAWNAANMPSISPGSFVTAPSIPLDEAGFHVSDWMPFDGEVGFAGYVSGERQAPFSWHVTNPGAVAGGSFYVGLCQLQVRGNVA
jgi:hypothetical protein